MNGYKIIFENRYFRNQSVLVHGTKSKTKAIKTAKNYQGSSRFVFKSVENYEISDSQINNCISISA